MKNLNTVTRAIRDHNRICLFSNLFHQGEHGHDGRWMTFADNLFNEQAGKYFHIAIGVLCALLMAIAFVCFLFLGDATWPQSAST